MKIKLICILCLLSLVLSVTSCNIVKDDFGDESDTTVSVTDKEKDSDSNFTPESESESEKNDAPVENLSSHTLSANETITVQAKKLSSHNLSYAKYTVSGNLINEHAIRTINLYSENRVYYHDKTDSSTSSAQYSGSTLTMFSYDMSTNQIIGSFDFPFHTFEEAFLETDGFFFMAPCYPKNSLRMMVIKFDPQGNTTETVIDVPAASPRVDIEPLSKDEILIFLYRDIDSKMADTIYKYNITSSECSVFYEDFEDDWTDPKLTSKNIRLLETANEKAYILYEQMIDGEIQNSLEILSSDCEPEESYALRELDKYGKWEHRAREMYCFDSYLYFEFDTGTGSLTNYPLLYLTENGYESVDISQFKPHSPAYSGLIDERYIVLTSEHNSYDLIVIDTKEHSLTPVKVLFEDGYTRASPEYIYCNEKGELLITAENISEGGYQELFKISFSDLGIKKVTQ